MFISSFLSLVIFLEFTSSKSSYISPCFSEIILLGLIWLLACLLVFPVTSLKLMKNWARQCAWFSQQNTAPKSKKSDDVISLWCTCIQVAVLYWENHVPGNTIHAGLYASWQFWLLDDMYRCICTHIDIYACPYIHIFIYMCHQIVRIANWHKAQHELFQMVFPVQHSY